MRAILVLGFSLVIACSRHDTALGGNLSDLQSVGVGQAHMSISCSAAVSHDFDISLALLHNFWYPRALSGFDQIIHKDPQCAMAYWGAAMTYNHPFWDAP